MTNQSESNLQAEIVRYMRGDMRERVPYGTFFSIPNEGKRSMKVASMMRAQGLLAGMPDLVWLVDRTVVFFELKTASGRVNAKQRLIHENLIAQGYEVHIIRSFDEFKKIVTCKLNE